jgi:hypothetical protein
VGEEWKQAVGGRVTRQPGTRVKKNIPNPGGVSTWKPRLDMMTWAVHNRRCQEARRVKYRDSFLPIKTKEHRVHIVQHPSVLERQSPRRLARSKEKLDDPNGFVYPKRPKPPSSNPITHLPSSSPSSHLHTHASDTSNTPCPFPP